MNRTVESVNMCMGCGHEQGKHSETCPLIEDLVEDIKRRGWLRVAREKREKRDEGL